MTACDKPELDLSIQPRVVASLTLSATSHRAISCLVTLISLPLIQEVKIKWCRHPNGHRSSLALTAA